VIFPTPKPNSDPKDYTRGIKKYLESDWTVINLAKARPDAGEVFSAVPRTVDAEQRYECDEKAAATTTVKDATLRRPVADEAAVRFFFAKSSFALTSTTELLGNLGTLFYSH
jgi:hypothetical protein